MIDAPEAVFEIVGLHRALACYLLTYNRAAAATRYVRLQLRELVCTGHLHPVHMQHRR